MNDDKQQYEDENADYETEPIDDFSGGMPDVSIKNTKTDLLKAYDALLKKYEKNVRDKKSIKTKYASDEQKVERAREYTPEYTARCIEDAKSKTTHAFNEISQKLNNETKKFEEVGYAIAIQKERLKELYDIDVAVATLEELIRAQEARKETFEVEYEKMKLDRQREQEEYEYRKKQEHKKEEEFQLEREESFKKRETELQHKEQELIELRKGIESFPHELEEAVKKTREETTLKVKAEMENRATMTAKTVEGEQKVYETRIQFLEETVLRQTEQIVSLKQELDKSANHVRSIAEKAIEGASGRQTLRAVSDIAIQQAGNQHPKNE